MNIKETLGRMKRVLFVASKPDKEEFKLGSKITGIGIAIIGAIGFVIFLVIQMIGGL